MRDLPIGTSYASGFGIGASLTVAYAMATCEEAVWVVRVLLVLGIIGCVVGLKAVDQKVGRHSGVSGWPAALVAGFIPFAGRVPTGQAAARVRAC